LIVTNTENEAIRLGNHLAGMLFNKEGAITKNKIEMMMNEESYNLIHDFKLMKLKIFDPSGETIYSTNKSDVGEINNHDYFHNIVTKGRAFTKVVQKDSKSLEGQVVTSDVVETYVPVMSEGNFIGAFEIYYDITAVNMDLSNVIYKSAAVPFFMNFIFLAVVTLILVKQDKFLIKQKENEAELVAVNEQLNAEIIERNRAEQHMMDFDEKLERSNRELQDFAHTASHDLQEPLRKVLTFGDRLKAKCADSLGEQGLDYLDRMQKASIRMQNLIQGLLMFSRVATKAKPFEPVNLSTVTSEVLSDLEIRLKETGGKVETVDLETVDADPLQVRQLFQNLISNALKFHKQGEKPVIKVTGNVVNDTVDGTGGDDSHQYYQITFEDNGIGFEEQYAERIFGAFQRLHGKQEYEGTGIGLSVCRKIVERHGGIIEAKSSPGNGAKFIVRLPVKQNNDMSLKGSEPVVSNG
jgi:signal transduction histidine kinase